MLGHNKREGIDTHGRVGNKEKPGDTFSAALLITTIYIEQRADGLFQRWTVSGGQVDSDVDI